MKGVFTKDKSGFIERNKIHKVEIFTEELIKDLPEPLKNHLRICGFVNTPVPVNADVYWTESWLKMSPTKDWGKLHTTQFNSVKPIARVAYDKNSHKKVKFPDITDSYKTQDILKIIEKVKVMWHLPECDFEYYKGTIERIEFNV